MANTFKNYTSTSVGTSATTTYSASKYNLSYDWLYHF